MTDALTIAPTGHLIVDPDAGGNRQLYAINIVNDGTVDLNENTTHWGGGSNPDNGFHNRGALNIAPEATYHQHADNVLDNQSTGVIVDHDILNIERDASNAGTFTPASSDAAHPVTFHSTGAFTKRPCGLKRRPLPRPASGRG